MKNLSEAKAGVIALNVVSDDNFLEINGVRIERKDWQGEKVLLADDISKIHQKETKRINEQFKRNRKRFFWTDTSRIRKVDENKFRNSRPKH